MLPAAGAMVPLHAGMKRSSEGDHGSERSSRSQRLAGPEGQDPSPGEQAPRAELDGVRTSTTSSEEEERLRAQNKRQEIAKEFIERLVLLVESHRRGKNAKEAATTPFSEHQWTQLHRVCEMYAESDLLANPSIKLASGAMASFEDLLELLKRAQLHREEYEQCLNELDAAITKRTKALLTMNRDSDPQAQKATGAQSEMDDMDKALDNLKEKCSLMAERLRISRCQVEHEAKLPLEMAERWLVEIGILQPSKAEVRQKQQPRRPGVQHSRTKDSRVQKNRAPSRKRKPHNQPQHMADILRNERLEALYHAEQAVKDIDHKREKARRQYGQDVREYLDAIRKDKVRGTKSDFDRSFLVDQMNHTREQKYAEDKVERAREDAFAVGAMRYEDTDSDHGYDDISDCGEDLLWDLKRKEIKDWTDQIDVLLVKGEPRAIGEDDWSVLGDRPDPGGVSIHAFSDGIQPYLDDILDEPERRKAIDDYRQKMDRLRATMVLRDLHW